MNPSAENHSSNLDTDWCSAERDARRLLESARGSRDPELLEKALTQLRVAWVARANAAFEHADKHGIQCTEVPANDEFVPQPGVHLITAPQVADARRLLTAGLEHGVPALALAREPMTKLGERPAAVLSRAWWFEPASNLKGRCTSKFGMVEDGSPGGGRPAGR